MELEMSTVILDTLAVFYEKELNGMRDVRGFAIPGTGQRRPRYKVTLSTPMETIQAIADDAAIRAIAHAQAAVELDHERAMGRRVAGFNADVQRANSAHFSELSSILRNAINRDRSAAVQVHNV